jgi:hypothetical protein
MATVLKPNALLGIAFPNHTVGTGRPPPQSFLYPGAVQPRPASLNVLSYTEALLGIAFPNHKAGMAPPQSFLYPGAVQPQMFTLMPQIVT